MDNFLKEKAPYILPNLKEGFIETNMKLDTKIDFICALDQAKFVADAFQNIEKYDKKEIDLASQNSTMTELANIIFKMLNKKIKVICTEKDELLKKGVPKVFIDTYVWNMVEGYKVDINKVKSYGIKLTSFEEFIKIYKDRFDLN